MRYLKALFPSGLYIPNVASQLIKLSDRSERCILDRGWNLARGGVRWSEAAANVSQPRALRCATQHHRGVQRCLHRARGVRRGDDYAVQAGELAGGCERDGGARGVHQGAGEWDEQRRWCERCGQRRDVAPQRDLALLRAKVLGVRCPNLSFFHR